MPSVDHFTKRRIVNLNQRCYKPSHIKKKIYEDDGIAVSLSTIKRTIKRSAIDSSLARKPGSGRRKRITPDISCFIDTTMEKNDATTLQELRNAIHEKFGVLLPKPVIHRERYHSLRWRFSTTHYCQHIRPINKEKRLAFALANTDFVVQADDMIFADECTVKLEYHRKKSAHRLGHPSKRKPVMKHPTSVHVWAAISRRGASNVAIFDGLMDRFSFVSIQQQFLKPFAEETFPDGYRLIQDNDPKHNSKYASKWMRNNGVSWFRTPPESPDLNPIELIWHELKEYIRNTAKPHTKQELIDAIKAFWATVDASKCTKYINHLRKVVPQIIARNGAQTRW